jgi:hypothetical protein
MRGHERQPDARKRNYLRAPVGEAARAVLLERRVDLFGDALVQHEPVHFGPTTQGGLLFRGHLLGGGRSACNQCQSACHPRQSACNRLGRHLLGGGSDGKRRWRVRQRDGQMVLEARGTWSDLTKHAVGGTECLVAACCAEPLHARLREL